MADYTYSVVVSSSVFVIDWESQAELALGHDLTYRFDLSHSSNDGHTFRFSTTSDGERASGTQYTTGYTTTESASPVILPGTAGAYVELAVTGSTHPTLYYYCSNHDAMGAKAVTTANTYVETQNIGAKIPVAGDAEDVWATHLNAGIRKLDARASQFLSEIDGNVEIADGYQAVWAGPIIVGAAGRLTISGTLVVI